MTQVHREARNRRRVFAAFSRLQGQPDRMREAFYGSTQAASVARDPSAFIGLSVVAPDGGSGDSRRDQFTAERHRACRSSR